MAAPARRLRPVEVAAPGRTARRPSKALTRSAQQLLEQHSHEVLTLPGPALQSVLPVLEQAQRELALDLRAWLARVPDGKDRFTAARYASLLAQLDQSLKAVRRVHPALAAALGRESKRAGVMATDHLVNEVARLSKVFTGVEQRVPIRLGSVLSTGESYLIPRFATSAARYTGAVGNDIKRELAVGVVRGESISALTDRLVHHGGPRGEVALRGIAGQPGAESEIISEGLFNRYRNWAIRVVRTETQAAYNFQLHAAAQQAKQTIPDLMRRWDASIDGRTCPECGAMDGELAEVHGAFPGGGPPLHPQCRCRAGVWRRAWDAILREVDIEAATPSTPPKGSPPVPPKPVPVEWSPQRLLEAAEAHRPTPAQQQVVREEARRLVAQHGLGGVPPASGMNSYRVKRIAGARGTFSLLNGEITLTPQVHADAVAFLRRNAAGPLTATPSIEEKAHGLRTLVHETIHSTSPAPAQVYRRSGMVAEEVTTEVLARRIMRTEFPALAALPSFHANERGSYGSWIGGVLDILQAEIPGLTRPKAAEMIETAAVKMRAPGQESMRAKFAAAADPALDYTRYLVDQLPIKGKAPVRESTRIAILGRITGRRW